MKRTEKDDAVSPVVGVMLMLVVTIIIAAVVATFASGVITSTEAAPNVVLDVKVTNESHFAYVQQEDHTWAQGFVGSGEVFLTSLNGDEIDTSKLAVKITNATGASASWTNSNPDDNYMGVDFGVLVPGQTMKMLSGWYNTNGEHSISDELGIKEGDIIHVGISYGDYALFSKDLKVTA